MALHQSLELKIPLPAVQSCVAAGARFTTEKEGVIEARYPIEYDTDGTTIGNLRFAFRHEPLSLLTLATVFEAIDPQLIQNLVKNEPTGAFSRRLWFFYEWIRGKRLDLESSKSGNYADALDSRFHFVAKPVNSPRHRVRNNLLGTSELCPTVRRTAKLEAFIATDLKSEALALTSMRTPEALARAANFL